MGLGPSIKMTTLHHYRCPLNEELSKQTDIDFCGIIVDGVSEVCDDKIFTAKRSADMAKMLGADAAIVAIDGWGNHHIDFVNIIEQLGMKGIPSVGLSYIGRQGRLVCTNSYVDCLIDFNKSESGYESCVVGQNNLTLDDAKKAVGLVKLKLKRAGKEAKESEKSGINFGRLIKKVVPVNSLRFGSETRIDRDGLVIRKDICESLPFSSKRIKAFKVNILQPGQRDLFVHSNLDFSPIACKVRGEIGEGITHELSGVTVMLTGVEQGSGFEPCNIGSSEGILGDVVHFDRAGTPASSDHILHVDVLFEEGEGRSLVGIMAAHMLTDTIVSEIRKQLIDADSLPCRRKEFSYIRRPELRKVVLIKIVSGLGNMYDTALFPYEPGGFAGARSMMSTGNLPYLITPNQCRDGVIHSLL